MRIVHNIIVATFLIASYCSNAQFTVDWLGKIGGPEDDYGYTIAVDSNENVFIAGRFRGQVSFDPNSNAYDYTAVDLGDVYIQKFDANGNFLWAKVFLNDSSSFQRPLIAVDQNDDVIISGKFEDQIDLDPGPGTDIRVSSGWGDNTYIVKLNNNGSYIWGNVFDNTSSNQVISTHAISIDNFGNILLAGNFQSTIDFDFGPNTFNMTGSLYTGFILKLDTNGNFVWAKQFNGQTPRVYFSCLKFDSQNNIIAGGAFSGFNFIDFDPSSSTFNVNTPENPNSHKIFVLKLSENGDFIWVNSADGYSSTTMNSAGDRVHSIVVDENDDILFTGGFRNNITLILDKPLLY